MASHLASTIEMMRFAQMLILECYASLYDIIAFLKTTAIKQLQAKFMYKYNYVYIHTCSHNTEGI